MYNLLNIPKSVMFVSKINFMETIIDFDSVINNRRSVRSFEKGFKIPEGAVERSLERAIKAPNSSNMQLWEFYRVISNNKKAEMVDLCLGQGAAQTASEFVVLVTRPDKWRESIDFNLSELTKISEKHGSNKALDGALNYYKKLMPILYNNDKLGFSGLLKRGYTFVTGLKKPVVREVSKNNIRIAAHKSLALAAQNFMLSITAEGLQSCPMEGFDSKRMKKLLNLPSSVDVSMVIAIGKPDSKNIMTPQFRKPLSEVCFTI